MKNIGIWLDKDKAYIVQINENSESIKTLTSELEHFKVHGGSGTRLKGGPQDVVQDSRYLEREKHQLRNYFNDLIPYIEEADKVAIIGPAETRLKFKKEIDIKHRHLSDKITKVAVSDSMTTNQIKAYFRSYFNDLKT